jgi:hypothetical protein
MGKDTQEIFVQHSDTKKFPRMPKFSINIDQAKLD